MINGHPIIAIGAEIRMATTNTKITLVASMRLLEWG